MTEKWGSIELSVRIAAGPIASPTNLLTLKEALVATSGSRRGGFIPNEPGWDQFVRIAPFFVIVLIVVFLAWKGFYTLRPHERAVVLRFGRYYATTGPGLHFMIPLVDQAIRVRSDEQSMRLPVAAEREERPSRQSRTARSTAEDEALELTGDLNAAVVEWTIQWRITDPEKYLFSIDEGQIETTIEVVAKSVMHRLIGDYSMDEILTGKREEVGLAALRATREVLARYDCGVLITELQMQRVTPPEQVKPAFDDVNAAIQTRDKLVNEAHRERNKLIPQARASADKLIREAEGYADRRRAESQGEIAALLAKFEAYKEAPEITRRRLYIEAMEEVLTGAGPKTVLDADLRGLVPLLELGGEARPALQPRKERP
jgi:modulator of FtsH protease HflK